MEWYAQYEVSKILDWLYLGNVYHAMELAYRGNPLGITAVLNVSTEDPYDENPKIKYLHVPFPDGHEIPPDKFAQCMDFLKVCQENGETVLVHCAAGISRSPSVVVSYIYYSGLNNEFTPPLEEIDSIIRYVQFCRPIVYPAPSVINSCKKWLRVFPYDGTYESVEPKSKLQAQAIAFHVNPECPVRMSILNNDNQERHLLVCNCRR